jgi:hypothetical protein
VNFGIKAFLTNFFLILRVDKTFRS